MTIAPHIRVKDNKKSKLLSISFISLIILLFIDSYIGTSLDVLSDIIKTRFGLITFSILLIASIVGSYLILNFFFKSLITKDSFYIKYEKPIKIVQCILYAFAIYLLFDIIINNSYYTVNLNFIVTISYMSSIIINLIASIKLLSWFKENRNKFILLFGISFAFLFINNLISVVLFNTLLFEKPSLFNFSSSNIFEFGCDNPTFYCIFKENIINFQSYTLIIYFVMFWLCNNFLLHHHIAKVGKIKFFILTSLPLLLFYFDFIYQYNDLYTISETLKFNENTAFAIKLFIFTLVMALPGILYGIGFRSVSNLLKISNNTSQFLKMASYGIILFFISANATIAAAGMPPFGTANIIFLPFASLLMYVGIFNSIRSISNDISVRKYIKNSAYKELKILGSLAESSNLELMKSKVFKMSKKYVEDLEVKSKVEITSSEEELKDYLNDAVRLFKEKKINKSL